MVRFTVIAALCALVLAAWSEAVLAQGRIVGRHGDWQIRCERPVGAPARQCALVQNVAAEDRANVSLTVIFLLTADRQARILRVLAPLGLLLPPGLGLSIDGNEVGAAGFVRCLPEGCIAEVELEDGLLQRFQAGETATFVIFQTPEEGIGIPISLRGFTEGFEALQNPPAGPDEGEEPVPATPQVVATNATPATAVAADRFAAISEEFDERSELDRLLEDDLLPYALGAFVLFIVLVMTAVWLVLRRLGGRSARAAPTAAAPPPAAPSEMVHDDMEPAGAGAARGERVPPRLAGPAAPRQMNERTGRRSAGEPAPAAPRGPTAPRG